jgi:hypothetical protein
LLLVDSAVDVILVSSFTPVYAPCCSSVYYVDPPFSPSAVFGPEFGLFIVVLTIVLSCVLIMLQWSKSQSRYVPITVLLISAVVALTYLTSIHDTLAPLVLGLPNHHCPYCLFQEFPDTALFAALFWVGVASAVWGVALKTLWIRRGLDTSEIQGTLTILRKVSSVSLLFSMVSMVSHLLVTL